MKKSNLKHISRRTFDSILNYLRSDSFAKVKSLLIKRHPADIADLIEDLNHHYRHKLLDLVPELIDAMVLMHLEGNFKTEVIRYLGAEHFKKSLKQLQEEDIIELVESLGPSEQLQLLKIVPNSHQVAVDLLLEYEEDSIGRSMSLDFIAIPSDWTVEKALKYIKNHANLPENCSEIFVVNKSYSPIGMIALTTLISSDPNELIAEIVNCDIITVNSNSDQEKAYALFNKYHFAHLPVIDNSGRMIGILRADDILKIVEEEVTEDILKLGGAPEEEQNEHIFLNCFARLRWLSISIINAIFSPIVISLFESKIQQVISLAALMPIVGSLGGNVGVQTVSVVIKAFSSKRIREEQYLSMVLKETTIGCINGLVLGIFLGIMTFFWQKDIALAVVLGSALLFCSTWAAFIGSLLPILFEKLGFDVALSSGPLVTTITDVSGYAIFLSLASFLLQG